MRVTEITERDPWNEALLNLPYNHVLQSYEWGQFKAQYSWKPLRLLFEEDGSIRAAASVLRRRFPHLPLCIMYVPQGPALDYSDDELLQRVLATLEDVARRNHAIFVKIDPDVCLEDIAHPSAQVITALERRGWRLSSEQIQFRNTILFDLTREEDELLKAMKSKTRYNVRLAERRGVKVRLGGLADLPLFYEMYIETSARDEFVIRPFVYYRDDWQAFIEANLAQLFIAEYEGQPLAGLILFRFGKKVWYMYGASRDLHRNLMPNYLLQWEAMRWAKAQGYTVYDMWGAPDVPDESDPLWGVYRFKEGFGGQFVRHIGAYDYPVSRFLYRFYALIVPGYLEVLRKRNKRTKKVDRTGL
ncbi:MAG: peptidoglycan bridge formation glycyltransferase FemA/FemB family protein [Anaerolineales bacterium]|nr:peptidoglycan bridge formation glycyltransferase FemA/FemB family protein [Anaerolineales bacterium]